MSDGKKVVIENFGKGLGTVGLAIGAAFAVSFASDVASEIWSATCVCIAVMWFLG